MRTRDAVEFDRWTLTTADEPLLRHSAPEAAPDPPSPGAGRRRPWRTAIVAAAACGALAIGGAVLWQRSSDTPVTEPPTDTVSATPGGPPPGPELVALPPAVASPLPYPGARVGVGRYETDLLGIPIAFAVGDPTALRTARAGLVLMTPAGTAEPHVDGARHVQLMRVAGWNTPEEAVDVSFRGVGSIDPYDIDGWFAENDVIVDASSERLVDGRTTEVFDLHVDPASGLGDGVCLPEVRPCFWFASVPGAFVQSAAVRLDHVLYGPTMIRFWLVHIDGGLPLLIEAAVPVGEESWLDEFEATTIDTIQLGGT